MPTVFQLLVHDTDRIERQLDTPPETGLHRGFSRGGDAAFLFFDGALEIIPNPEHAANVAEMPWISEELQGLVDRAEATEAPVRQQKGEDGATVALDRVRQGAATRAMGEPVPPTADAPRWIRERWFAERSEICFAEGVSRILAIEAAKWRQDPGLVASVDVDGIVETLYKDGSSRHVWAEGAPASEAAYHADQAQRAKDEAEAEAARAHDRELVSFTEAKDADALAADVHTGERRLIRNGGVLPEIDLEYEPGKWILRLDSERAGKVSRAELRTMQRINALAYSYFPGLSGPDYWTLIERARPSVERRACREDELVGKRSPECHAWLEAIDKANEELFAGYEWLSTRARAIAAANGPAYGIRPDVYGRRVKAWAAKQHALTIDVAVAAAVAECRAQGKRDGLWASTIEEAARKVEASTRARAHESAWTEAQIDSALDAAYSGRGAIWTPCSLRFEPSKRWLDLHHARVPALDPELGKVAALLPPDGEIAKPELETKIAEEGIEITPSFRARLAAIMGYLGFGTKQVERNKARFRVWARAEKSATHEAGEPEGEAAE